VKVLLIAVGAPKSRGLASAIRDYERRIGRYFRFEAIEVRPQRVRRGVASGSIVESESAALLDRVPAGFEVVAVDERGDGLSSEDLARYLEELAVRGRPGVAFLIGGPLGLSDALRSRAQRVLALSSFTLPHELARLLLVEQIYRAGTIQRGEPYHKGR
jgi:23S rRNA (pseudouridine1915-N3)-methyltransferase